MKHGKKYINAFLPNDPFRTLAYVIALVVLAVAIKGFFEFWQESLVGSVVNLTLYDIRSRFYRNAIHQDVNNFGDQGTHERRSQAPVLPGIGHYPGSGRGVLVTLGWHQPVDFGAPGRVQFPGRRLDGRVPQPVRHRGHGQPPGRPEALGAGHHGALPPRHPGNLRDQPGLPHPGVAADQRQRRVAGRS